MKRKPDFILDDSVLNPLKYTIFHDDDGKFQTLRYNNQALLGAGRRPRTNSVPSMMAPFWAAYEYSQNPESSIRRCSKNGCYQTINNAALAGGAKRTKSSRRKMTSQPLIFRNPFYSTGAKVHIPTKEFKRPINGLSTIGAYTDSLRGEPLSAIYSQPGLANEDEYPGAYSTWTSLLPKGVQSVENRDRMISAQRELEAQHAGIYSKQVRAKQALHSLVKTSKKAEQARKIIQYISERLDEKGVDKQVKEATLAKIVNSLFNSEEENDQLSGINERYERAIQDYMNATGESLQSHKLTELTIPMSGEAPKTRDEMKEADEEILAQAKAAVESSANPNANPKSFEAKKIANLAIPLADSAASYPQLMQNKPANASFQSPPELITKRPLDPENDLDIDLVDSDDDTAEQNVTSPITFDPSTANAAPGDPDVAAQILGDSLTQQVSRSWVIQPMSIDDENGFPSPIPRGRARRANNVTPVSLVQIPNILPDSTQTVPKITLVVEPARGQNIVDSTSTSRPFSIVLEQAPLIQPPTEEPKPTQFSETDASNGYDNNPNVIIPHKPTTKKKGEKKESREKKGSKRKKGSRELANLLGVKHVPSDVANVIMETNPPPRNKNRYVSQQDYSKQQSKWLQR